MGQGRRPVPGGEDDATDGTVNDPAAAKASGVGPRETRERLLPATSFPMWVFDRGSRAIVAANDAALREYGYTREQLLECKVDDICVEPGSVGDLLATPGPAAAVWTEALWQRRKDGSTFEADVAAIESGDAGHPTTMVLVKRRPRSSEP